ncbi:energy transducer TonB [Sphingorhabdus sp. Alg239-R122]|uniref:energy transducer TonB n=1 Tax=Sphingorhabdus sp. Alg239-R122 TaxID=2305989 RepID=UPI0013DB2D7F|nr:energy transducer TonB [Sphingorhabdus sp. Alg239-R122]
MAPFLLSSCSGFLISPALAGLFCVLGNGLFSLHKADVCYMLRMSFTVEKTRQDRLLSIAATLVIHVGIVAVLVSGFAVQAVRAAKKTPTIVTVNIAPPPPPPVIEDKRAHTTAPEGRASAANMKSRATNVAAPKVKVPLPAKTDIVAAKKPMDADDTSTGASNEPGKGTGAGGAGDRTGSGGQGDGTGGGNIIARAQKISGQITQRDYPKGYSRRKGVEETVVINYTVMPNGRVADCRTVQSSGNPALDTSTCQLVTKRFRYSPARNAAGKAVSDVTGWKQVWWIGKRR